MSRSRETLKFSTQQPHPEFLTNNSSESNLFTNQMFMTVGQKEIVTRNNNQQKIRQSFEEKITVK